jgi:hypothetical protein
MKLTKIKTKSPSKQKKLSRQEIWRRAHLDYYNNWTKEWRKKNPEKSKAIMRKYYLAHREERIEANKKYLRDHLDERRAYLRAYMRDYKKGIRRRDV